MRRLRRVTPLLLVLVLGPAAGALAQSPTVSSVTLNQSTLFWGQSTMGTVTLSGPAPTGGTQVNFVQQDQGVTTPTPVIVQAGQTTATFTVTTSGLRSNFDRRNIDAVILGVTGSARAVLNLEPVMYSISLPPRAVGGSTVQGTLSMGQNGIGVRPAPANISVLFFVSQQDVNATRYLTVPQPVVLPAGQTSVPFSLVTKPLPLSNVDLNATLSSTATTNVATANQSSAAFITLESHKVTGITLAQSQVTGGQPTSGMVTLNAPAPPGGLLVPVRESSGNLQGPAFVNGDPTVPAGSTQAGFNITTRPVTQDTDVTFRSFPSPATAALKIVPAPPPLPTLASLALADTTLFWGQGTTGTLTLSAPAPAGGSVVAFADGTSGNGLTVPSQVTIPAGQTSATFAVTSAASGTTDETRGIGARTPGSNVFRSANLRLEAVNVTLSLSPDHVAGVAPVAGTASMGGTVMNTGTRVGNRPAPANVVVTLSSTDSNLLPVPTSVTIPAGQTSVPFTLTPARAVTAPTYVRVTGTGPATVFAGHVTLDPLRVSSVVADPARVIGGSAVVGTVTLNGPAPSGGSSVTLQRQAATTGGDASAVTLQPSVTVPAGQTRATFNVTTAAVTQERAVTILAGLGSPSASTTLTLVTSTQGATQATAPMQMAAGRPQMQQPQVAAVTGDLAVASITVTRPRAKLGDAGPVGRVEVESTFSAPRRVAIAVSLATQDRCDGGQVYATLSDRELRSGRTPVPLPAPSSLPADLLTKIVSSGAWVCARVDAENKVPEKDEGNNCRCARVP